LEAFSFGQVAGLARVKARTLDHWAATGFLAPSIKKATGTGTRRVYSFSDVVAARVARDLRSAGASLQGLRKVVRELRKREFAQSLAEVRLIVSGKDVYLMNNQDLISVLQRPGQVHFPLTVLDLEATIKTLRSEAEKMVRPISAEPIATHVEIAGDAGIDSGMWGPIIAKRRPRQLPFAFTRDRSKAALELSDQVRAEETERAETIKPAKKTANSAGLSPASRRNPIARRKA